MKNSHRTNVSNVLVIGSGGAGLRAAMAAHTAGCEVVVVGKRLRKDAHTVLAAGGFSASFPANSITLVVIPPATPPLRLFLPLVRR
jgi:succinate dehydrogenase/fumarate reductase flavoprotein subunit